MRDYLLFIDTEGSGLPENWNLPYSVPGNWPYSVQVAWLICDKSGKEVKHQNHYIKDTDFDVSPSATKIHGITHEFLQVNGVSRTEVMDKLFEDLTQYQPMVVGHFLKLDAHMVGADFYREGKESPINKLPTFCTMNSTRHLTVNPENKFLRLSELYYLLFKKELQNEHNALVDAIATAQCFFELLKRGEINCDTTEEQLGLESKSTLAEGKGCTLFLAMLLLFIITIAYYL